MNGRGGGEKEGPDGPDGDDDGQERRVEGRTVRIQWNQVRDGSDNGSKREAWK